MWIITMEAKNIIAWTAILVIIFTNALAIKLNASEIFDESWPTESDLENELEQKRAKNAQWSPWSDWSTCSRSCDGGVSQQLRRCNAPNGCKGENIRFRLCNMQPCPEQQDFRAHQCLAFNDVPYDGTLYRWTPHNDYTEPCSLFCRGRPAHLPDDESTVESEDDESEHFDEPSVIVQLSNRVQDGTRCRMGSLDMCIQGKCQRVGCDLKIGSTKKVDACGVCGGDGNSCSQPLYHWEMTPMSLCSSTCGGDPTKVYGDREFLNAKSEMGNKMRMQKKLKSLCINKILNNTQEIYEILTNWVKADFTSREKYLKDLLHLIDFSNLSGTFIQFNVLQDGTLLRNRDFLNKISKVFGLSTFQIIRCNEIANATEDNCKKLNVLLITETGIFKIDLENGICQLLLRHNINRSNFAVTKFGSNKILISGGSYSNKCECYSPDLNSIEDFPPMLEEKIRHRVVAFGDKIYAFGGRRSDAMEIFDINTGEWTYGPKMPHMRCNFALEELSYKMSQPVCKNRVSGIEVEDSLCSATTRPEPSVVQCNTHSCPPRWIVDDWSSCSRQCGGGIRQRAIVCAEENNSVKTVVPKELCSMAKPPTREECNLHECPKWVPTEWSGCSVSCGTGLQIRGVECMDIDGTLSAQCDPHTKPHAMQECSTGIPCHIEPIIDEKEPTTETEMSTEDEDDDIDEEDDQDDNDSSQISYNDQPSFYSHSKQSQKLNQEEPIPKAEKLVGEHQHPSTEPTFIKDTEWSQCSVTCGEGIRRKEWRCKIFLEYSRTIAMVNDSLCEGAKPKAEIDHCVQDPCMLPYGFDEQYPRDSIKVGVSEPGKTYVWREQGYTSCSASCLGGVEELIINCVREDNGKVVSPFLCAPETKPEARVRTCNDRPCPPRWNYSDYSPCSKSCGIGIKTREVQCIHEVTRGGENTMVVPNSMCPQPPPADRQYCNVLDCPVRWEVGDWSKCSHTCGYGIKERKVECKQIMAQEHKIERPESMCPSSKPADKKPCNVKPCPPEDPKPIISVSNSTYKQHDPKKSKITLKIGGAAEVFFGTQVKIKCPVKRYNRTKIRWSKDNKPLPKGRKFKVSKKGALRILDVTFRDTGVYSCHAGLSTAEINIDVKAKPGMQPEDYATHRDESDRSVRERSGTEFLTSADMTSDGSSNNRKKQKERSKTRPKSSDVMQHAADSSVMEDESQLMQQAQGGIAPSTSATNSGSRNTLTVPKMPYFQALLTSLQFYWPFQKFSNSKGHHLLMQKGLDYGIDLEQLEKDEPSKSTLLSSSSSIAAKELLFGANNNNNENGVILGHGNKNDVKFEWLTTEWSECSQKCGTIGGLRKRSVNCIVRLENSTQTVDNVLCEDAGIEIPDTFESCGNDECPKWETDEWTLCQRSRCFGRNTAIQKRQIYCRYKNLTDSNNCDENDRPIERQECYNELCRGVWRVEPWSECNGSCGRQGIKYRILQCVWYGTRKPAGNACRNQPRPAVMKVCKSVQCMTNFECKDTSRYCKNVRSMGLCRLHRYQQKCCKSCRFNIYN